jgi:hypothetical protein
VDCQRVSLEMKLSRFLLVALVLTSAAVAVTAQEDDDVDRTDFSDDYLKEDKVASDAHPDIEPAALFPESPDNKLPVGGATDLLIALANAGPKMFNVSFATAKLLVVGSGATAVELEPAEFGQSLGPHEQRSFRFPLNVSEETILGEYNLVSMIYYNTRDKEQYLSLAINETVEVVPPLPDGDAQLRMLQAALGVAGILVVGLMVARTAMPGDGKKGSKAKAKGADADSAVAGNEWLAGTLAGSEGRQPKKTKRG